MKNEEVHNRIQNAIGVHDDLLTMVKKRKLRWYGHISRSSGMAKAILQGAVKGLLSTYSNIFLKTFMRPNIHLAKLPTKPILNCGNLIIKNYLITIFICKLFQKFHFKITIKCISKLLPKNELSPLFQNTVFAISDETMII